MEFWESEGILQDSESCFEWQNLARIVYDGKTVKFIHMKCGHPLQVSMYVDDMHKNKEYDYHLHFRTKCMHCQGHKRWSIWRKSYINSHIKLRSTISMKHIFMDDLGDHVYGIHGIARGNNCVFMLDKHGGRFGKLKVDTKSSRQALSKMQKYRLWNIVKSVFYIRQICFYWLEVSQKNKLTQMIQEDYESLCRI